MRVANAIEERLQDTIFGLYQMLINWNIVATFLAIETHIYWGLSVLFFVKAELQGLLLEFVRRMPE